MCSWIEKFFRQLEKQLYCQNYFRKQVLSAFIRILQGVFLQCTEQSFEIPVNLVWKNSNPYRYTEVSLMNFKISKLLEIRLLKDVSRVALAKS